MADADRQGVTDNSQDRTPKPSNPPEEGSKGKPQRDKGDKGNETTPTTGANATPEVEGPAFGGGGEDGNEHRSANTPPAQLTPPEGAAGKPAAGTPVMPPSYDEVSKAGHIVLGTAGMFPGVGAIPDAVDLIWTAAEMPFGKSNWTDLGLSAAALGATVLPGTGDVAAGTAKVTARSGEAVGDATALGKNGASLPLGSKSLQFNQPKSPPYQPIRNNPETIGGTDYSGHSIDRMQDRGVMPSVVQNTIDTGVPTSSRLGATLYYDPVNNVSVVTNAQGKVVTVKYGR